MYAVYRPSHRSQTEGVRKKKPAFGEFKKGLTQGGLRSQDEFPTSFACHCIAGSKEPRITCTIVVLKSCCEASRRPDEAKTFQDDHEAAEESSLQRCIACNDRFLSLLIACLLGVRWCCDSSTSLCSFGGLPTYAQA